MDETKEVRQIPIEEIIPNRFQPRINFDEKSLEELSSSIKQHGIIQPLVLRPLGDKFEIIAGERRYKAATLAGLTTVPAIVTEMDDKDSAEVALIENVQRKDLSSIEEAKSYKNMLDRSNMTQEELAKKMGLSQSTIANKLRLLNLSEEVQDALMHEKISERHARALLSISNKEKQKKWLDRIIQERLTVRQLDLAIKDELNENNKQPAPIEGDVPIVNINPDIDSIINNAVDINPVDTKKDINFLDGTNLPQEPIESLDDNVPPETPQVETTPITNVEETPKKSGMPNKFFNFLEDEEVNMNMTEEPKNSETKVETNNNGVFGFQPEFQDAPENNFEAQSTDNVESLDTPAEQNVVEDHTPIFDINAGDETTTEEVLEPTTNIETTQPVESNQPQTEELFQLEPEQPVVEQSSPVEQVQEQNVIENIAEPVDTIASDFIFDDDEDVVEQPTPVENITPVEEAKPVEAANVFVAEPIPVMEGEGIVDPVAYYDTLDPGFVDKLRQSAGLDLKTAINTYRDITSLLNEKGFAISIDEADMGGSYRIQIDIKEE